MVIGQLSSVNLIAAAGILGNIGGYPLGPNAVMTANIATYDDINVIAQFTNVKISGNILSNTTAISLDNLASNIFPVLTNVVPADYISSLGNTPATGFTTGVLMPHVNYIMGNGDPGIFEQVLALSDSYVITNNLMINTARNANNLSAVTTYQSQDVTVTGGLSQITQAFSEFGADFASLGFAINFEQLSNLGSPQALLGQIYSRGSGKSELNTALLNAGIPQSVLDNLGNVNMTPEQQKIVFDVMTKITGSALLQVLSLLKVTTRGITNLADLLNPVKAFPRSYNTLTAPTSNGIRGIYVNSSGAVNTNLETILPRNVLVPLNGYQNVQNTYSQLKNIIPPDWALANKALQAGLEQATTIFNSNGPLFGAATNGLESNKGLDLINALTSPLPAEVSSYFDSTLSSGSGINGTFILADLVGTAGGWIVNDNLPIAVSTLANMSSNGNLITLTNGTNGVFTVMQNALDGDYTIEIPGIFPDPSTYYVEIPSGLPGAGTYSAAGTPGGAISNAFDGPGTPGIGLIPAAYSLIGNIVANATGNVTIANSAWSNIAAQIAFENSSQTQANIVPSSLIGGTKPTTLALNIASYGKETTVGGAAWFLESVANTSTLGGQAIVSTMREVRNQGRLQEAGIQPDIIVSSEGVEPQQTFSAGQYTVAEAVSQKII